MNKNKTTNSSKAVNQNEVIKILVPKEELKGLKRIIIKKGNKLYLFESTQEA